MYSFVQNNCINGTDILGLDSIIVVGGPSLSRDGTSKRVRHDQNPWNFINPSLNKAMKDAAKCYRGGRCCCKIEVMIYEPPYRRRQAFDSTNRRGQSGAQTESVQSKVNGILARAGESKECIEVSYFSDIYEIIGDIRTRGKDSIDEFSYFGHAAPGGFFLEYGSLENINDGRQKGANDSTDEKTYRVATTSRGGSWDNQHIADTLEGRLNSTGSFNHYGCNGAECAKAVHGSTGAASIGAVGQTSYGPVGASTSGPYVPPGKYQSY